MRMGGTGHVWQAEGCLIKKVMIEKSSGKRPPGKPRDHGIDRLTR